ncbi:hypothetical protein Hanom_Chr12g01176821 [Helianthus anomalus]
MPTPTYAFSSYQVTQSLIRLHDPKKTRRTTRSLPESPHPSPKIPKETQKCLVVNAYI